MLSRIRRWVDPAVADPRPAERRLLQPLGVVTKSRAVPPGDLDPIRPLGAEHAKRPAERISTGIAHQRHQPIGTFAEVHWMAGQKYLHPGRDHAERTAQHHTADADLDMVRSWRAVTRSRG
ncbi:hypothetical protein WH91_13165 [Devosia psychrophila]|uniref:Uncharacterized protein n=1 Tax=Devosia psychrophila TaxID=728005 RepID=A0ABR5DX47_9HYPH|nr:hypothetical protein WH91_13165 [Devosia psychrophila]